MAVTEKTTTTTQDTHVGTVSYYLNHKVIFHDQAEVQAFHKIFHNKRLKRLQ